MAFNTQKLIDFVKEKLGCQCPDEVFNLIELVKIPDTPENNTIILGNKLMVVFWYPEMASAQLSTFSDLLEKSITYKQYRQLNRLRCVMISHHQTIPQPFLSWFEQRIINETNIHLHTHHISEYNQIFEN